MSGLADSPRLPSVSAVVATFNGAAYIAQQLSSILDQSDPVDEIVIADDRSTDGTLDVVLEVAAASGWPTDRLIITQNLGPRGVAANVVQGIARASGSLIALADQDDVWHLDKVAVVRPLFARHADLGLVHSDARLVDAQGRPRGGLLLDALGVGASEKAAIARGDAVDVLLRRNVVTGATVVLRRDLAQTAGAVPPGWIHDEWFAVVAAILARVDLVDHPLIDYRQHGSNQIGASRITFADRVARLTAVRDERNARLLQRADSLLDFVRARDDVDLHITDLVERKARHEHRRSAAPRRRWARLPGVADGLVRGDYRRFGGGLQDALRDLVQPTAVTPK